MLLLYRSRDGKTRWKELCPRKPENSGLVSGRQEARELILDRLAKKPVSLAMEPVSGPCGARLSYTPRRGTELNDQYRFPLEN
ncbi:MAG: hypothetical protein Q8O19_00510, partial [Rectinemataceae bacterium]|nr:hypothetical protein [Rectinemataceae bacterium]